MIGLGYHGTHTPPVVLRNVLENPAWYTAYTPYQPEISQGRLEVLLRFQTDRRGPDRSRRRRRLDARRVDRRRRGDGARPPGVEGARRRAVRRRRRLPAPDHRGGAHPGRAARHPRRARALAGDGVAALPDGDVFGVLVQYPGRLRAPVGPDRRCSPPPRTPAASPWSPPTCSALCLLRSPAELGADVACGTTQRFGVPLGFGGPHAGYLAVRAGLERSLPGRLVGVSVDADGNPATRLALQTREQHIRREKATSNICTAQVLLAVMAALYAQWHGPDGLSAIAAGPPARRPPRRRARRRRGRGRPRRFLRHRVSPVCPAGPPRSSPPPTTPASTSGWSTPTTSASPATRPRRQRRRRRARGLRRAAPADDSDDRDRIPASLVRRSEFLDHPAFTSFHSETSMLRELRRLADQDLALDRTMIPLGSCTMKLNATTEMEPVTWPEFGDLHPFAPPTQAAGYRRLIGDLERWLCEITGYDAVSLQPNAGSQGELAGLLAIRAWHRSRRRRPTATCASSRPRPTARTRHRRPWPACGSSSWPAPTPATSTSSTSQAKLAENDGTVAGDHGHLPLDPRRLRARHRRAVRARARRRRPGLRRRRQPQRPRRPGSARAVRRRRQPPQPPQDLLHPPRRRRPGRRTGRGAGAPGAVPPQPPARGGGGPGRRRRADLRRPLGVGGDPADPVGLHPAHGCPTACAGPARWRSSSPTTWPADSATTTRSSTPARAAWSPTSASSTSGRSPSPPASPSTTSPSG